MIINATILLFQIQISDSGWCNNSGGAAGAEGGGEDYSILEHFILQRYFISHISIIKFVFVGLWVCLSVCPSGFY